MRVELASQITGAQAILSEQLAQLQAVTPSGADSGTSRELLNQLASLKSLSLSVATASGGALAKLRADVSASVAASAAAVQQAQGAVTEAKASAGISQAEYDKATAELGRRAATLMAENKRHDDEAHERARRNGIDLTAQDEERRELERQKREAIARGDKDAERQLDVLIAKNTKASMVATGADSRDIDSQQGVIDGLEATRLAQAELKARRKDDTVEALPAAKETSAIHAALTPEAREATKQAAASVASGFGSFASSISLDGSPQVALSAEPDAHTKVEVPRAVAGARTSQGQSLA